MGLTLQRDERVLKSSEFRRILRQGKRFRTSYLTLVVLLRSTGRIRLGLTVSRKVGNAVVRNRVKRRLREAVRLHRGMLSRPWDIVVIAQPGASALSFHALGSEVQQVLDRLARQDNAVGRASRIEPHD